MQSCPACHATNQDTAKFCAQCGNTLGNRLLTGAVLQGRYQLVKRLGQGGFGAVYLATDQRLGNRQVAVKENLDTSQEAQAQFQLEATTLANLTHPNLPRVMDHFIEPSGKQYLVMDFVGGEDVDQVLEKRGPLPEPQALAWLAQVSQALEYLHQQKPPIIHRDIKPANIRITPEGKAILVDFGLAKPYQQGQRTVNAARAVTTGFSPPEQYGAARTDARSDIYALAATLYTMLTGQVPPDAMDRLTGTALRPPRQIKPSISPATESAILRALDLNPAQRPPNGRELYQARTGAAQGAQTPPPRSTPPPPAQPVPASKAPPKAAPIPPTTVMPSHAPLPVPVPSQFPMPIPRGVGGRPLAGFGRRVIASIIDSCILLALFALLGVCTMGPTTAAGSSLDEAAINALFALWNVATLFLQFVYSVYFHSHSGQTPGKKMVGIKVVSTRGAPVGVGRAIVRWVSSWLSGLFYLGYLWAFVDDRKQTWHDKLAQTCVVRT